MSSDVDSDFSFRRNLRQRQRKKGDCIDDAISDLEKSKRKGKRKGLYYGKYSAYDEYGNIRSNGLDVCKIVFSYKLKRMRIGSHENSKYIFLSVRKK